MRQKEIDPALQIEQLQQYLTDQYTTREHLLTSPIPYMGGSEQLGERTREASLVLNQQFIDEVTEKIFDLTQ